MGEIPSKRQLEELAASDGILTEQYFYRIDPSDTDEVVGKIVKISVSRFSLQLFA